MGNSHSKSAEVEVPRRKQNRLSKPRTNTSTVNLLNNAPSVASRRNSQSVVPSSAPSDKRQSYVTPENAVIASVATSRRLSTRQRLRGHLFRSKSSDGSSSRTWSLATREDVARDAAIDSWESSNGGGKETLSECESRQLPSRPTSRRGSSAYTPYSHHASRLSLVVEAHTPEPNMNEASQRLEQLSERIHRERDNSDASVIPMRRRSILMTPGVATRRNSNGDILYESFPVSRRLSTTDTMGSRSRRSSWFDNFNPGQNGSAEILTMAPLPVVPSAPYFDDAPRTMTPCEEEFGHLGAYKLGTLRITNADSIKGDHEEDGSTALSLEIPRKNLHTVAGESPSKSLDQQDVDSFSPFSFEKSRTPSPKLQITSKHTAVEDELFEDDLIPEVAIGSPEHALRILDGTASSNLSVEHPQASPVMVANSLGSLKSSVEGSKEMTYKPLTKNDSGYSSNVSLRSFKAKAEARAAAEKDALERRNSEASKASLTVDVLPAQRSQSVSLATINAPPPLPEKSAEQKKAAASEPQSQSSRPSLTISRNPSNPSQAQPDLPTNSSSTLSPASLMRRLTKGRRASQPIVTVTSDRKVDCELIPPVSASASAKLEERQKDCPALSHTYKNTSRTNSRETLITIMSMPEPTDTPAEKRSPLGHGKPVIQDELIAFHLGTKCFPTPEERMKAKALKRRTTQLDFETHITSFGTVSESLGASPYDLAVSAAMAPRKRSHSSYNLASDHRLHNSNRSHSSSELAPHNIRKPLPSTRTGMDAETAVKVAREKSRDREITRRMSIEKLRDERERAYPPTRDDRSALPSNRMALSSSLTPSSTPPILRSPRACRRDSSNLQSSRVGLAPPVTMTAYRKSLPPPALAPQASVPKPVGSVPLRPAVSSNSSTYPQSGPWVPQRPQGTRRQTLDVIHPHNETQSNGSRRSSSATRPSLENNSGQYEQQHSVNSYYAQNLAYGSHAALLIQKQDFSKANTFFMQRVRQEA